MNVTSFAGEMTKFAITSEEDLVGLTIPKDAAQGIEVVPFVASTLAEDSDADILNQNWNLTRYRANPIVLFNHHMNLPVGRSIRARVPAQRKQLELDVQIDDVDVNPQGKLLAHMYREKLMRGGSVGFQSDDKTPRNELKPNHFAFLAHDELQKRRSWRGGFFINAPELFEFTLATIPANPEVLSQLSVADEIRQWALLPGDFETAFERWLDETSGKSLIDFMRRAIATSPLLKAELALNLFLGEDLSDEAAPISGKTPLTELFARS